MNQVASELPLCDPQPDEHGAHRCSRCGWPPPEKQLTLRAPFTRNCGATPPGPCRHQGAATGEELACKRCQGKRPKVFACAIFGECTLAYVVAKNGQDLACCKGCPRNEPAAGSQQSAISNQQPK